MGSHVRRPPPERDRGGRDDERENKGERKQDKKITSKKDRVIQNTINKLFYSEKFDSASDLLVKKSYSEISNKEHLTFLLTTIDVINRIRVERVIDKDEFISTSLDKASSYTGYKFDKENKEIISNIIKNEIVNIRSGS